jgi:hypothetical protein
MKLFNYFRYKTIMEQDRSSERQPMYTISIHKVVKNSSRVPMIWSSDDRMSRERALIRLEQEGNRFNYKVRGFIHRVG